MAIYSIGVKKYKTGRLAWLLALVAIAGTLAAFSIGVFLIILTGDSIPLIFGGLLSFLIATAYAIVGMLVASQHPKNPIGWIFLAVSWLEALGLILYVYRNYGPAIGARGYVPSIFHDIWMPTVLLPTIFVFLLFPDGRLISRWWRIIFWSAALGLAGTHIAVALHPGPLPLWNMEYNPDGIASLRSVLDAVLLFAQLLLVIGILGSLASFAIRFRRSQGIERQQLKWLGYALTLMLFSMVIESFTWSFWSDNTLVTILSDSFNNLALLGIALATSIAILRHRLYDIDVIINRTLVYGALTVCVVGVYTLVVGGLGMLFQSSGNLAVGLVATGLVAVLFSPLRQRLQRTVNRLLYGERDEPFTVLRRLGERLESSGTPEDLLPAIVETVSQALKLPYAEITLRHGEKFELASCFGVQADGMTSFPIQYQSQTIGYLNVAFRGPGESFDKSDEGLLRQIAWQAGPIAYAAQLTRDLRQSRTRLVTAREDERRRLRRDLHDGLGPVLASQGLKIAAVSHLLEADPERARRLLDELASQNEATVTEIRRLVYALRPPELDELGLMGAVRDYADGLNGGASEATHFQVNIQPPDGEFPGLPAAIEVAAYRIATEALTNVMRHAHARHCTVQFLVYTDHHGDVLKLEIADDGIGFTNHGKMGVGLNSMRERAEEVQGEILIESTPHHGTVITASLPLSS